jgi:hypothetical protein
MRLWQNLHLRNIVLFTLLLWISTSCYVPIRQTPPDTREYYPAWREDFTPGETSRVDVLLTMGEPDEASADETVLTYRWSTIDGIIIITQCTPPVELTSETAILFTFDADGVLQAIDVTAG